MHSTARNISFSQTILISTTIRMQWLSDLSPGKNPLPQKDIPAGVTPATRKKGRPTVPDHLRRIQIRPGYRVPAWVADWMKGQGDIGRVIEDAVVGFYGLTPPEPWQADPILRPLMRRILICPGVFYISSRDRCPWASWAHR